MKASKKRGFTIVELIVVIAVIGILAGITSVSYGAWRIRAASDVLKSDLTQSASQLKSELNWRGQYPSSQSAVNNNKGLPKSPDTIYQYTVVPANNYYCLTATSPLTGVPRFMISSDNPTPREGVC